MKRNLRLAGMLIACVVALGAGAALWGHQQADRLQDDVLAHRRHAEEAQRLLVTIGEADANFRAFLLYGQPAYATRVHRALNQAQGTRAATIVRLIDSHQPPAAAVTLQRLVGDWIGQRERGLAMLGEGDREGVLELGRNGRAQETTDEVRNRVERYLQRNAAEVLALKQRLGFSGRVATGFVAGSATLSLLGLLIAFVQLSRQQRAERQARQELARSSGEMTALLRITDMLQSGEDAEDVASVVRLGAGPLLPGNAGALFLRGEGDESRVLRRAAQWGEPAAPMAEQLTEGGCWTLKRGRAQSCGADTPCEARGCAGGALCLPISARGEELGVLRVEGLRRGEGRALLALADGISLALSSIRLRQKLRAQALRDALTGLHNRRFLQEVGERMAAQAQRRGGPLSVLMLDIDHFKALNDRHGHAVGDAALRRMGEVLLDGLRRTDVACRYGGEEFVLLLPDCGPEAALERAEQLCRRVEHTSGARGTPAVTVSIGVATLPEAAASLADTLRLADEALYAAKAAGRNRVVAAAPRPTPPLLRLATA